jgi:UV DNA damage repair endonuclease
MSWGLDASLELANDVALVLDLHHHWIRTGEYIDHRDDRIKRIQDSWRGVRPVVHFSTSREDVLVGHNADTRPDLDALLAAGYKKQKLRAHSDFAWNQACNAWALEHNTWADIMVEAKGKNLASQQLHEQSLAQVDC